MIGWLLSTKDLKCQVVCRRVLAYKAESDYIDLDPDPKFAQVMHHLELDQPPMTSIFIVNYYFISALDYVVQQ